MAGLFSYIGGKNRLAKWVIEIFPKHTTYVEAFAAGAQVFFHKEPSPVEVLNDLDGEIVNCYRVCREHYEELLRYFRFMLLSRSCPTPSEAPFTASSPHSCVLHRTEPVAPCIRIVKAS